MSKPGIVFLVGAGPGDPGLLTLKGLDCLQTADVVVYDYLANPELLQYAPAEAERIYVGKSAGQHTLSQEQINELLVRHGAAGKRVTRLKGGDPFVFGRGGEEALALLEAGVAFEVVPGITSGIAAPAYAGIPITQRGVNVAVTFVTGHEDPLKDKSSIDWQSLAWGAGTLVFYMGVGNLPSITARLMECGRSPDTPVALVGRGTLPEQQVVEGTLATIAERVKTAGLKPPAITVIGDVVALRHDLKWFERTPLFGRTIVVTRSRTQASTLARELRGLGARVLLCPTIHVTAPEDTGILDQAVAAVATFDGVVLTSPNAVEAFFTALTRCGRDARALARSVLAVTGPATAEALAGHGLRADVMPSEYTAKGLGKALREHTDLHGKRLLLPRSSLAPPDLPRLLREAGAEVTDVVAYCTVPATVDPALLERLRAGDVDAITFTSSSTARYFATMMRNELGHVPVDLCCFSMGPETTKATLAEGLRVTAEAAEHTIPGLIEALVNQARNGVI